MNTWKSIASDIGGRRAIVSLGALYVLFAIGLASVEISRGDPVIESLFISFFIAGPGVVLLIGGYWLPRTTVDPQFYPTITTWSLGAIGILGGILTLYHVTPGTEISNPARALLAITAFVLVPAFAGGINDARSKSRAFELKRRSRQQQVVATLGQHALETDDLDDLMHDATQQVANVLDNRYCKVLELDDDRQGLLLRQGIGWNDGIVGEATVSAVEADSQAAYTLANDHPIVVEDLETETRFSGPELLTSHNVRSGISTGIGPVDEPWGILSTHDVTPKSFTDEDVAFVQGVANVLASAIDHAERTQELEEYEWIVETIDDGIYVNDEEYRFRLVNDAYAELMGCSREELIGSHVTAAVDEETLESAASMLSEISPGEGGTHEFEVETVDGTRTVETKFTVLGDDDGGYAGSVGILRDVTERNERERQLERFERIVETVNDGVYVTDGDGHIVFVNDAFVSLSQHPREKLLGAHGSVFFGERFVDMDDEAWQELTDGERDAVEFETEIIGPNGHPRVVHNQFVPLEIDGDVGRVGVTRDITELTVYQRKLEESNERLEQFAYAASHDLQEPLRMVTSYLQLIERRYGDDLDDDGEEFLDFAVDGAERMRAMIDGLLEYSRVDSQGESFEPIDLTDVVADVRRDLEPRITESDAEIHVEELPRVRGDASQLRQVFQNLLKNAIDYSGNTPPRVSVSAESNDTRCTVSVRDEGVGIDPAEQDRIFEIFQRVTHTDEQSGSGIGLALCDRIVERNGGEIWVESELGKGATFSFTLPLTDL